MDGPMATRSSLFFLLLMTCAGGAMVHAAPAGAEGDASLVSLSALEAGEWELRPRNAAGAAPQRVCVADPHVLLQPRHAGRSCRRFVIDNGVRHAAVAYNCPDGSNGRTDIRVETSRLVQIDAQGVDGGMPFAVMIEARKVGQCQGKVAGR